MVAPQSGSSYTVQTELKFRHFYSDSAEKPENLKKHPRNKARTNNKLNSHMTPGLGSKPWRQWREASVLTTMYSPFTSLTEAGVLLIPLTFKHYL